MGVNVTNFLVAYHAAIILVIVVNASMDVKLLIVLMTILFARNVIAEDVIVEDATAEIVIVEDRM